ncbi:methylosome protein 50-like [Athalia rosae]|uniref:methylosome protein 50-like n=1 Tax=Athalia rosae TaxID=37344 RepID=UPI0020338A6C|nr:methylosome protein 50-like [Athalia rosae]XP_020710049.2 methylosome protein 50-like [Athalia rosae]XP_048508511.1 methylosome protein 50-like [Athalia rosae]
MESLQSDLEPHLNAEIYRNLTPADTPPTLDRHLQFILISKDIGAILGASDLTGRYWSGTIWYFKDHSKIDRNNPTAARVMESGVCDAAALNETNKFVVGEDSGVIQILSINEMADTHTHELQCLGYSFDHDDSITSISTFDDNIRLVTTAMDYCIKVWDMVELYSTHSFSPAHTEIITCVQSQPKSSNVFASTSLDRDVLLWDLRQSKPAKSILKDADSGLTAAAWNPDNEHEIVIGDSDGKLLLLDVRQESREPVFQSPKALSRSVHRLLFNKTKSHQLAGCCDSTEVKVFDTSNEMNVIYEDKRHQHFVRGLAWDDNSLVTASWDSTVAKHVIPA